MTKDAYGLHAHLCSIFANPKRLEILDILRDNELTVTDILEKLKISKTNLSQHLSIMKDRGILRSRRVGQHIYYSIANKKVIQAYDLMRDVLKELMNEKISKLS